MNTSITTQYFEGLLRQSAYNFDLWGSNGRNNSNKALTELFFGIIKNLKPSIFIEAGAMRAENSIRARKLCPEARVVAFEANPFNYHKFTSELDYQSSSIEYLNIALNEKPGILKFNIISHQNGEKIDRVTGRSSILRRLSDADPFETQDVESTSLDTFFPESTDVALWVDVEGASRQVLSGGLNLLKSTLVIMIEVEDKPTWADQWLCSDVIEFLIENDFIPVARDFEYRNQYNIVFLKSAALRTDSVKINLDYYFSVLCKKDWK